jgi:hypothetical protein
MSAISKKMEEAFKKTKDIDFDLRFMAAQDLCEIIVDDKSALDEDQKVKIIDVFINQLDDGNKEVRSHAVRCISKTLYKINEISLKKTIDKIFENFKKDDIDIYSVCLKTIVNNIELTLSQNLCANCLPHIHKYITTTTSSEAAVEQSLDILNTILKKFPQAIRQDKTCSSIVEKDDLVARIQELLETGNTAIKRAASACLGSLAHFLDKDKLTPIADRIFKGISSKDLKATIIRVQTLALLGRNGGSKLDALIPNQTEFFLNEIKEHLQEGKVDVLGEEHLSQYLSNLLQIIETSMKNSDRVLIKFLRDKNRLKDLEEILQNSLHFNPNMPEFLAFDDEEEGRLMGYFRGCRFRGPRSSRHKLEGP